MNKLKLERGIINHVKVGNRGQLPDERQQLFNGRLLASAVIFGIAFDVIMMIYYFVTKNIENAYPYVAQIIVMSVGCVLASFGNKEVEPPTILFSKRSVNTDKSAHAFISRIAWCLLDSLIFAAIITAFDAYTNGKVTGSLILDGILSVCVFWIIDIIICEIKVHRYRKYIAILDAEENDLSD